MSGLLNQTEDSFHENQKGADVSDFLHQSYSEQKRKETGYF